MPESRTELIDRMERLYKSVSGPGMGTSIRGTELGGMLEEIRSLRIENAQLTKKGRRRGAAAATESSWTDPLAEVLPAVNDILEGHPELWGQALPEALEAWGAQQTFEIPDTWAPAVTKALTPDDETDDVSAGAA